MSSPTRRGGIPHSTDAVLAEEIGNRHQATVTGRPELGRPYLTQFTHLPIIAAKASVTRS
jgi:hypothetical protein